MSIESFVNCLEHSIDDLWKGDSSISFSNNDSQFVKFGKNKWEVIYRGTSQHSNLVGVSYLIIYLFRQFRTQLLYIDCYIEQACEFKQCCVLLRGYHQEDEQQERVSPAKVLILNKYRHVSIGFCESDLAKNNEIGQTKYSYWLKSDGKIYNNKSSVRQQFLILNSELRLL